MDFITAFENSYVYVRSICSQRPLRWLSPYGKHLSHGVLHRVHRNLTSAGYSASSVEKYHYHSDCHRRSGSKPNFRSGVLAHTPKRRSHGVPIFGLSSEIMSQVPVYSVFKDHEAAPVRSQELTPSHTLNKGWVLAGCFSKKLKKFFRDPLKQKSHLSESGKAAQGLRIYIIGKGLLIPKRGISSPSYV